MKISRMAVERCSLIEGCLTNVTVVDIDDGVYNYACTLCHYSSLVMEFRDAWQEGGSFGVGNCFCHTLKLLAVRSTPWKH